MATELEELVGFLSSPSPAVTKAAVDIVRGLTGSDDGLQSLANYSKILLPSLSRLVAGNKEVAEPAAEALVNLSQNSGLAAKMVDMGMINVAMDVLYKPGSSISPLLVMLLVNLTQLDVGVTCLLQTGDEKMQGLYVMKLVRSFCRSSDEASEDPFEHVGSILVNISKQEAGRKLLLDPKRGLLRQVIRQFDSPSPLRRKGVSAPGKHQINQSLPIQPRSACLCLCNKELSDEAFRARLFLTLLSGLFRVNEMRRSATKAANKELERIDAVFNSYANASSGLIDPEGIERLCSDLEVDHTDVRVLMLAWKMKAEKQGYFTLEEWRVGLKALRVDNVSKLKKALPELEKEVRRPSNFVDFYSYAFRYCLTEEKQKSIDIDSICELLNIVLGSQYHSQVDLFTQYLKIQNDYKVINMDQWMGFYRFCDEISFPDLSNYDPELAWPLILDNFVEWIREKQSQS